MGEPNFSKKGRLTDTYFHRKIHFNNGRLMVKGITTDSLRVKDELAIGTGGIIGGVANGHITVAPNGTGDVRLDADTVRVGDNNANATITTNGTGDLILNTNAGTDSGSITIQDAANQNIVIAPNGTGKVSITGNIIMTDAKNIELNTNTGTQIGTAATQKLGFYGANPTERRADANQLALDTATNTVGTAINTKVLVAVGDTSNSNESGNIMNNIATIAASINEIRTVLVNLGLMKGSA